MKRILSFLLVSLMLAGLLAACGGETATTAPTAAAPTAATGGTEATATTGTTGASTGPEVTGEVTLWHAYSTGGTEDATLTALIAKVKAAFPSATINVLQVPFDQVFSKFENDVAAGSGPDLLLAPNDSLGDMARKNLLLPLDEKLAGKLGNIVPTGVEGMKVDGKLYGVPESFKAVALYYNTATVPTPPTTTDELLAAVKGGKKLVLNQSAYHNFGFYQAFGGQFFDASKKCGLTTTGADAIKYLQDLKAAGATFSTDGGQADALFREGKADMIINGPWVLGDYKKSLADKLGVAPMPAGPKGPAGPLTGVDGFYVNQGSTNPDGAVALALYLTNTESQTMYAEQAGHVPTDSTVKISDKLVQGFADAAKTGVPRPQDKELSNFWTPFGDALTLALDGGGDAGKAITDACTAMDTANAK